MKKNSFVIKKIITEDFLEKAFSIRKKVFVEEQQVAEEEEYDEFENTAIHFIVLEEKINKACATARWRFTDKGIKLERFAVLKEFRNQGIGQLLLKTILEDIAQIPETEDKQIYLHAQLSAMNLYAKFHFVPVGEMFEECNIKHYKMVKK